MNKLITRKLIFLFLFGAGLFAESGRAENVALVFAPGEYQQLEKAEFQTKAADKLKTYFESDRDLDYQVKTLTGESATRENLEQQISEMASLAAEEDVFVVVVHAFGTMVDDTNLVCAFDSRVDPDGSPEADSFVSTDEILNIMLESPSKRRLLVVDPIRPGHNQWRFGIGGLKTTDNQWVFVNRSSNMAHGMTRFMHSILDGLTWHGDANANNSVNIFELSEYMRLYAESQGFSAPFFMQKANGDFAISTYSDPDPRGLDIGERDRFATKLLGVSHQALFHEHDAAAALVQLDRALRFQPSETLGNQLNQLRLTSRVLIQSDDREAFPQFVETTLQEANENGSDLLLLVADQGLKLYPPQGTKATIPVEMGTQLAIDRVERGYARVERLVKSKIEGEGVVHQTEEIPPCFLKLEQYRPDGTDPNNVSKILGKLPRAPEISAL